MSIHTVQQGDSVYSIARQYGVPASRIITDNMLISGFGLRAMLLAGVVIAVAGTLVFFLTVDKKDI